MAMGDRIREARERAKLTQQQVADHFGVVRATVSSWERGIGEPPPSRLSELAHLLGTTVAALMGEGDGEAQPRSGVAHSVPLLSPTDLSAWARNQFKPVSSDHERVQCSVSTPYGKAVAMQVTNNAMAPLFPNGCIVIVSRAHPVQSGDAVVVDTGRGAPMLRYMIDEGAAPVLSAENPQFPLVPLGKAVIIGRVIEVIIRRILIPGTNA
jgi:repressor LexA